MSVFGWFKSPAAKANEAMARIKQAEIDAAFAERRLTPEEFASRSRQVRLSVEQRLAEAGIGNVEAGRARRAAYERERVMEELEGQNMAFQGNDEGFAYNFALQLYRRVGPSEASRLADMVVKYVQMFSRSGS